MGVLSSAGDFFGNLGRRSKELGDEVMDKAKGLRGQAKAAPGPSSTPNFETSPGVSEAIKANAGSGEAQSYLRGQQAQNASFQAANAPAPKPGFLSRSATNVGRLAGPAAAASEVYSAGSNISAGENPVSAVGRSLLRGGTTMLGGAAGAALGTLGGPVGTLAGGVAGSAAGYKLGDTVADKVFGPEGKPSSPIASAQAAPAQAAQPNLAATPATTAAPDPGYVDLVGGDKARPAVLTDTTFGVPVSGQGAFRRTGTLLANGEIDRSTGGTATKLGGPDEPASAGLRNAPVAATSGAPRVEGKGLYKFRADTTNAKLAEADATNKATLAATVAQRDLELRKWMYEKEHTAQNEQEKRVGERTADYVRAKNPAVSESLVPGSKAQQDYEAKVKQETADVGERLRHTLSVTKQTPGKLNDDQHSLLLKANDIRNRLEPYRSSKLGWAQDFFGSKRFDSKNLYSYLPARDAGGTVKPAIPKTFGYSVEMGNGNKMKVYSAVNKDGTTGFNFTGPNDPVDADAMEIMTPAIKAAQQARKK